MAVLQVFIAHSGQRLEVDAASLTSLDTFKDWVAKHSSIAPKDHISLTAQGKAVRLQTLSIEKEIYVYDRRIVQSASPASLTSLNFEIPQPANYSPPSPPDTINDQNDLQAWKDLFQARHLWAQQIVASCAVMSDTAQKRYDEIFVIAQCLEAAYTNLEKHLKAADEKNREFKTWVDDILKEQASYGNDLDAFLAQLKTMPTTAHMVKFITGRTVHKSKQDFSLEDLIDVNEAKRAGKLANTIAAQMERSRNDITTRLEKVFQGTDKLNDQYDRNPNRHALRNAEDPVNLLQDIEALAKKVHVDLENVLEYSDTAKNISQASKSALIHTRNFLPSLSKRSLEMQGLLKTATQFRNSVAAESLETMHELAGLTALLTDVNTRFGKADLQGEGLDAFNLLTFVHSLPITYASLLAEAVKRREWSEKVKSDSSTLSNEMAAFQDEEARRRRKWQKSTGALLWGDKAERRVIGLEVNLQGEEDDWPQGTRQELDEYCAALQVQNANDTVVKEIKKIVSELDNPTKQQSRRAKAFKAGSIHEAALGRSALLLRGDDDLLRSLQEEKTRTEGKLRTAESRIRRLEDLLHRQSHVSRASTSNVFQTTAPSPESQSAINPIASPRLQDDLSRRSSVSSRRFSANQGAEEKAVLQKVLGLEAELIAERERASGMEKEISAKIRAADDMRIQVEEANSTKMDLMQNFEAQQREFIEERKSLEDEIKRHKAKVEELEDEMDRFVGSRENVDDRTRSLQDEVERLRNENVADVEKAQGQVDFLRHDAKLQRETNENLEKQLEKLREENRILSARANRAESAEHEQIKVIQDIHKKMSSSEPLPNNFPDLAEQLLQIAENVVAQIESNKRDLALAKADAEDANSTNVLQKAEINTLKEQIAKEEKETARLRDGMSGEQARFAALEAELADERLQLSSLRTKIADGETGSEVIRGRLEQEESKVITLSEDLATKIVEIGSLEEELRTLEEKHEILQAKCNKLTQRFEDRTLRTKQLTQRLYAQNDQLCIMLEQLSYVVTREGGTMSIQRLPKPERSTHPDMLDPLSSLRRSVTGAVTKKAMTESADLELLYWMHNDDTEAESHKYQAYLNIVDSFDIDAFCNTMMKRVRDLDYTIRKYSRDARSYREKSHSAQKEAHEKIAFKSFKEGDLALFLPTRNQATGAWAAFNVGAPHYFLKEQDSHKLRHRDWLVARITKIEDRVVDLSKSISSTHANADGRSFGEASFGGDSFEDDNPFDLSDGLRWYLIEAHEEKPGAPSTPGLGKSTVASTHIDASGDIRRSKKSSTSGVEGINKTLSKSLDSRRSSNNSKKSQLAVSNPAKGGSGTASLKSIPAGQPIDSTAEPVGAASSSKQESNGNGNRGSASENPKLNANASTSTGTSPSKKSMIFESLWSLDLSLDSRKANNK